MHWWREGNEKSASSTTNPSMQKGKEAGETGSCSASNLQGALDKPEHASGWEQSPGAMGRRSPKPFLRRTPTGTQRSCNARFKSPVLSRGACQDTNEETLQHEVEELKRKNATLDQEIAQLLAEGYNVEELDSHIALLHEYNEMKDSGQMLLGQMALIRGVTTKELYPEFDLDLND